MTINVGCGRVTWGGKPDEVVLPEIAEAGYDGASWWLPPEQQMQQLLDFYAGFGLRPAPGYFGGDFWLADRTDDFIAEARRLAKASREAGLSELFVCTGGFDSVTRLGRTRRDAAAHAKPEDGLSEADFETMTKTLDLIGAATREEGVQSCYHNHVGTYVETEDEIERMLSMTDPNLVALGPDTGHLAWAGVDVVSFFERHLDRIKTMHVKDVDQRVRAEGVAAEWRYGVFEEKGLWTEIGEGSTDFSRVFSMMASNGFTDGWVIVETDRPTGVTPLESAKTSRANLRGMGV